MDPGLNGLELQGALMPSEETKRKHEEVGVMGAGDGNQGLFTRRTN